MYGGAALRTTHVHRPTESPPPPRCQPQRTPLRSLPQRTHISHHRVLDLPVHSRFPGLTTMQGFLSAIPATATAVPRTDGAQPGKVADPEFLYDTGTCTVRRFTL